MHEAVEHYYGQVLARSSDLRTNACTTSGRPPPALRELIARVHPEVRDRYYGCGLVYPAALDGMRVLDLGCGSGRDCYVLAQLVGADGAVVGVDMTDAQLDVARRHLDWHMSAFGHPRPNVSFHKGYIERLDELALAPASFDVIVSNCVINLAVDKGAVLRGACRLLKPGGELYFSDVYASRRVPAALAADPVLYGECLGGALYWNDFEHLA
ncbi:MAG: methyltransferase domain-containing protein, partial [Gammaproteobacteria bacterium]